MTAATTTTTPKKNRIDWKNVVVPKALEEWNAYVEREESKPTLRTIYYILLDNGTIPGTASSYGGLSEAIVAAKKRGDFPKDAFVDNGREVIADFPKITEYNTPSKYVDGIVNYLKNCHKYYSNKELPRWHNQEHYVEAWIEKNTMAGVFENYLKDRLVRKKVTFLEEEAG